MGFGCLLLWRSAAMAGERTGAARGAGELPPTCTGSTSCMPRGVGSIQTEDDGEYCAGLESKPQAKHVPEPGETGALHIGQRFSFLVSVSHLSVCIRTIFRGVIKNDDCLVDVTLE